MNPLSDDIPPRSPGLAFVYSVLDGIIVAVLLVEFLVFGRRPKDWGPRE